MITSFRANHKPRILIAFLIASVTFIFYIPSLKNGFVNWDDDAYVYENKLINSIDATLLTAEVKANWHPLTMFSLALDYAIWGLNPKGYHFTNNFFHAVNTFLIFLLIIQLLEKIWERANYKILIAGVTAYLFGVHPLHVESVAWVSERKDVLCAFFYLLSILSYLKYVYQEGLRKYVSYGLCLTLFLLALLSKPMAVSLPIVLLLLDFYPLKRLSLEKRLIGRKGWILLEKAPFLLFALVASLINISAQEAGGALKGIESYPLTGRICVAISAYVLYLVKMILPFNLSPYYRYPAEIDFFSLKYLGSLLLLIAITVYSIRAAKKEKVYLAVWSYYVITLLPVIGIFKVGGQAMADRYTYLPSIGHFLLVGLGIGIVLDRTSKDKVKFVLAALIVAALLMGSLTIKQAGVWKDPVTFWSRLIRQMPDSQIPYLYRGNAYFDLNKYESAIEDYSQAVTIDPTYADAFNNRGYSYYKLGLYQNAVHDFDIVLALDPKNASAYNNRGMAHGRLGNLESAIYDFNRAIILNPSFADAYYNRGNAYEGLGEFRLAIMDYNHVILLNPSHTKAYARLNKLYSNLQK